MILLVDKPSGMTSQAVVSKIKYAAKKHYGKIRIGHTGTLDPMCTGLLPVLTHEHTKLSDLFPATKAYRAGLLLGMTTDTEDITGRVLSELPVTVPQDKVFSAARAFVGKIRQTPPMYSAVKVGGERLYTLARKGIEVERAAREVEIFSLDCLPMPEGKPHEYLLQVRCSSGTYIRTLCAEIGKKLGCGGCMSFLRRTESNGFFLSEALPLSEMVLLAEEGRLESVSFSAENVFSFCPETMLPASGFRYYLNGGEIASSRLSGTVRPGLCRVYSPDGGFCGLGNVSENGMLKSLWRSER